MPAYRTWTSRPLRLRFRRAYTPPILLRSFYPELPPDQPPTLLSVDFNPEEAQATDTPVHLIPKPSGEVSRPGRQGYTLANELKWDPKLLEEVQVQLNFIFVC